MMADIVTMNSTFLPDPLPVPGGHTPETLMAVIGILSFFCVLGTIGNLLVLYVYVRKRNKLASTVFIITLACTDFITCALIIPFTIVLEYVQGKVQYDILCKLYMFLITSNVPFSAFIMMAIAVDRYLCICHPFTHILNTRRAKLIISILASLAFILGIITALNFGVYFKQPYGEPYGSAYATSATIEGDETAPQGNNDNLEFVFRDNSSIDELSFAYNKTLGQVSDRFQVSGKLLNDGVCKPNGLIFSHSFTETYQKIYSSFFVIVIVVVVVLYIMIYRFVTLRRARRRRIRKQASGYSSYKETGMSFLNTRTSLTNGCIKTEIDTQQPYQERKVTKKDEFSRQMTIREKGLVANIRTAGMLFVVTAVFIVVFLPAWLMAHQVVPYNMLVFYMYFFYNVANPIIYAFMNKAFRRDLKDVIECRAI